MESAPPIPLLPTYNFNQRRTFTLRLRMRPQPDNPPAIICDTHFLYRSYWMCGHDNYSHAKDCRVCDTAGKPSRRAMFLADELDLEYKPVKSWMINIPAGALESLITENGGLESLVDTAIGITYTPKGVKPWSGATHRTQRPQYSAGVLMPVTGDWLDEPGSPDLNDYIPEEVPKEDPASTSNKKEIYRTGFKRRVPNVLVRGGEA